MCAPSARPAAWRAPRRRSRTGAPFETVSEYTAQPAKPALPLAEHRLAVSRSAHQATRAAFAAPARYIRESPKRAVASRHRHGGRPGSRLTLRRHSKRACPAGLRQTPWHEWPRCSGQRARAQDTRGGRSRQAELPRRPRRYWAGRVLPGRVWAQGRQVRAAPGGRAPRW